MQAGNSPFESGPSFVHGPEPHRCSFWAGSSSYGRSHQTAGCAESRQFQRTGSHHGDSRCSLCGGGSGGRCLCWGLLCDLSRAFWPCLLHWLLEPCCPPEISPSCLGCPCIQPKCLRYSSKKLIAVLWTHFRCVPPVMQIDNACAASSTEHTIAHHSTAQHSTAQHSTAQHSTAQHSTAQHSTGQHITAHV